MSKIILFSFLGCICFLYTLNLFLKGAGKQIIKAILGLLIVVTVVASFFVIGWRWGLVMLICPFVLIGLSRPLAQALACRLLGHRVGYAEPITDLLQQIVSANEDKYKKARKKMVRLQEKNHQKLCSIAHKPAISSVLQKNDVSFDEYENLFNSLWLSSLHDLSWEIVSTPIDLDSLIQMKKQEKSQSEIYSYFRYS